MKNFHKKLAFSQTLYYNKVVSCVQACMQGESRDAYPCGTPYNLGLPSLPNTVCMLTLCTRPFLCLPSGTSLQQAAHKQHIVPGNAAHQA